VRYIVEGSVRKAGNRVRVSAQLIDATTGDHIWAERYDRVLEDIFAVQDDVTQSIVATLPGRLENAGAEQASRKPTDNIVAYDYILRGEQQLNLFNREGNDKAIEMFEKAIDLDPQCSRAYAGLGFAYQLRMWVVGDFDEDLAKRAHENAQKALSLDSNDSQSHAILCDLYMNRGEHDRAGSHIQKAITLNPNNSFAAWEMVFYLAYTGRPEEAIDWGKKAIRLNPYHPEWYLEFLGDAYYMACRYDEAIETLELWDARPYWINLELAAFYAQVGRMDEARNALEAYERTRPAESTLGEFLATHKRVCKRPTDWAHWHDGYRKAGLQ
jgi:adenylate cyclase